MRYADEAHRRARPGTGEGLVDRVLGADALQHRVGAHALRQVGHPRRALVAALGHHLGGAEPSRERLPVGVPGHRDDPLGAHPGGRQDAEQTDGAVADHDHRVALADVGADRSVPAGAHHIGEREQARDQRRLGLVAQRDEGAVGQRDPHVLRLRRPEGVPVAVLGPEVGHALARRLHPDPAMRAGVVADGKRADDEVAGAQAAHLQPDLLDHPDELVADRPGLGHLVDPAVGPQVGAAHAGGDDADDRVRRGKNRGVRDVVEADVARGVQDGRLHGGILPSEGKRRR